METAFLDNLETTQSQTQEQINKYWLIDALISQQSEWIIKRIPRCGSCHWVVKVTEFYRLGMAPTKGTPIWTSGRASIIFCPGGRKGKAMP